MINSHLKIKSSRADSYVDKVDVGGSTFLIQTEDMGTKSCKIITKTYNNGAIVHSKTTDYSHLAAGPDLKDRVKALMDRQHQAALDLCLQKTQKPKPKKSKALLGDQMKTHLGKNDLKAALGVTREALQLFPEDPFFLSHSGYLTAVVDRKRKEGCSICEESIKVMAKIPSEDKEFFYPILYLNLGRTYLICNQKKAAIEAFREGLKHDPKHKELQSHVTKLGRRRPPVLPFLDRSNPINKYLGKIRHKMQSA